MTFSTDLHTLDEPKIKRLCDNDLWPSSSEYFFKCKQQEIRERYDSARRMMCNIYPNNGEIYPPILTDDENRKKRCELYMQAIYYEASLTFYNMVIDLSWVMVCGAFDFSYGTEDNRFIVEEFYNCEKYIDILSNLEQNTTSPNDWSRYFSNRMPSSEPIMSLVMDFWNTVQNHPIRGKYNYIKHRGRPVYKELFDIDSKHRPSRGMYILEGVPTFNNTDEEIKWHLNYKKRDVDTELPTHVDEMRKTYSLIESIDELKDFDENKLFPYITNLFDLIDEFLQPSNRIGV